MLTIAVAPSAGGRRPPLRPASSSAGQHAARAVLLFAHARNSATDRGERRSPRRCAAPIKCAIPRMNAAHLARLAVMLVAIALTGVAFLAIEGSASWLAAAGVFAAGCILAELAFRRLADPETLRRDLEDRVRNPPD
jgi:fatty acid desaturase